MKARLVFAARCKIVCNSS